MKNTLLEELIALGIQAKIDRITERLGLSALGVQAVSRERESRLKELHAELLNIQFLQSIDSDATLEERVKSVIL